MGITCSTASDEFILHMDGEHDYHYASRRRQEVVQVLTQNAGHLVLLWEKQEISLTQWVTQKRDLKKGAIKRPPDNEAKNYPYRTMSLSYHAGTDISEFERCSAISKTNSCSVTVVRQISTGCRYAMKQIRREAGSDSLSSAERLMIERMRSPFLAQVHYTFETPAETFIVMDFIHGVTLKDQLNYQRRLTEEQALFLGSEITLGLAQLHSMNLAYARLRPSNIVLKEAGHALLWDFASVRDVRDVRELRYDASVPQYVPPECLKGEVWGLAADWWSFGIVLYEVMVGITPFESQNIQITYNSIKAKEVNFSANSPMSSNAKDLICRLLSKDPSTRLGVNGAHEVQAHPFFASVHLPSVMARQLPSPISPNLPPNILDSMESIYSTSSRRSTTSL